MKLVKKSIFGGVICDISRHVGDDDGHLAIVVEKTGCQFLITHRASADKQITDVVRHSKSYTIQVANIGRIAPNKGAVCCRVFSTSGPSGFTWPCYRYVVS